MGSDCDLAVGTVTVTSLLIGSILSEQISPDDGISLLVKGKQDKEAGVSKKKEAQGDDLDNNSCELLVVSNERSEKAWILDSASSYLTPEKKWFSSYVSGDFKFVHLGDDASYRVVGVGNGVKHVAGLRRSLISLRILHEQGWLYQVDSDRKTMKITKDDKTVITSEMTGSRLYKLQGSIVAGGVVDGFADVAVHDTQDCG
uniref:Retrovirus-related Pol polyprotein from transposon TNT 1-94-like beta-barrel domain-containing protein n=1 Tax=Leersia perrieri TaxID=77586 RepID=A0A0D9VEK5_9ORYZ